MLKELQPDMTIEIFERLDVIASESSAPMNNAGTGHSAFCELNYTPQLPDGTVEIKKAIKIAEQFEISKEFWTYLLDKKYIPSPESFIRKVPHMSFVWGADNVTYLKKRQQALTKHHFFKGMEYSEDKAQIKKWIPLVMEGRDENEAVSATFMDIGTDVNFGSLTSSLIDNLKQKPGVNLSLNHDVTDIKRTREGNWLITVKDKTSGKKRKLTTKFVFVGAGGGALPASKIGHSGEQRLWRFPGKRPMAGLQQPRCDKTPRS
jgi:malate dehydrogenase (quinone)